jgi:hypothetical protein
MTIKSSMSEKPREPRRRRQDCRMTLIMTENGLHAWRPFPRFWFLVTGFWLLVGLR